MENQKLIEKLKARLEACNYSLEYAAFNYDGAKLKNLQKGLIESTGVSDSCLIEVRENKALIEELTHMTEGELKDFMKWHRFNFNALNNLSEPEVIEMYLKQSNPK